MSEVDVSKITDVKELKAIAYDLSVQLSSTQQQLQLVLAQLQKVQFDK